MKPKTKKLLLFLALPLGVGGLGFAFSGGMGSYKTMNQPPLSPPGWVFPVVWTVLYLLMGYASYRVTESGKEESAVRRALGVYLAQLFLNFLWPIVFFGAGQYLAAFILLIALWIAVCVNLWLFSAIDEKAGDLLIPYIIWVTFAGYLNLGVYLLN